MVSCFPDSCVDGRDVEQAYWLAPMEGPPTYIVLPKELWTPIMHKMHRPVVLLEKALYGHPSAGAFWHKYCNFMCLKAGFRLFPCNWPCTYWHAQRCTALCVYVDDIRMVGNSKKKPVSGYH